jgi:hypothetical protein
MRSARPLSLLLCALAFAACNTISSYDQAAYQHATDAKAETLALMSKATTSYSSHTKDIADLDLELDKAYEYDKGRSLNQITTKQWEILRGPDSILNRFFASWQKAGTLDATFIADKKEHVAKDFDDIIQLENGKNRKS